MEKINFEAGTIVTPAKVNEDKTITPAVWEGKTPLSPFMLNKLQENIEKDQIEQNTVIDELKAKTIKCLQEVETPTPVSGTSIDINDSADAKITELKISGNSKQETREGYNKLKPNEKVTSYGLTGTPSEDKLTISGTSTTNPNYLVSLYTVKISEIDKTQKYKLRFNNSTTMSYIGYRLRSYNGTTKEQIKSEQLSSVNFKTEIDLSNISDDVTQLELDIISYAATNTNISVTLYPMIYKGTEEKTFEQYGASPSPDYPSEVESCGDNINIFDKDNMTIGKIWSGATLLDSDVGNASPKIPVKAGKTYIRNVGYSSNYIIKEDNSVVDIQGGTNAITIPENAKYWTFNIPKDIDINTIKAEEGLISTLYSPYGQGCINEVICNKNFMLTDEKDWEQGTIDTQGNNITNSARLRTKGYVNIPKNKELYASIKNKSYCFNNIFMYKQNNELIGNYYDNVSTTINGAQSIALNLPIECSKIRVMLKNIDGTSTMIPSDISKIQIQLKEGSKETDYVEHKSQTYTIPTQQPFRAIGDTRDTFIKKNNKWYERHYSYRLILDGTETWYMESVGRFCISISKLPKIPKTVANNNAYIGDMCNYYKESTPNLTWMKTQGFCFDSSLYLRIYDNTYSSNNDLDGFKSWLSTKYDAGAPVYIDYITETPTDIECTEEQSTILFDIEQNAKTYDKATHMYSTDKISSYKEVTYKKDIETLFANTLVEGV